MRILLTGHKGFIGSNLLPKLQDHDVTTIDILDGNNLQSCDLPEDIECVIHLAGRSGVRDSIKNPNAYFQNNVLGSLRIFEKYKNARVIYASSSTAAEPDRNPYAYSKMTMEKLAPDNSVGLRFTTVYGPNAREFMFIPKLLNRDVRYVNTNHTRDFIHVDDICRAIIKVMDSDIVGVMDVGTGETNSLIDIVNHVGLKNIEHKVGDEYERLDNQADIKTLMSIGWQPTIKLFDYLDKHYG
jgi:UDP-glucuronate 4-epimerase